MRPALRLAVHIGKIMGGIQAHVKQKGAPGVLFECVGSFFPALFFFAFTCPSGFAQPAASSTASRGQQIFLQQCAKCHGTHGEGISALMTIAGPNLQAEHDRGQVMTAVEVGPSHMPTFTYVLPMDDIRAVADYVTQNLATIPLAGGDISKGGELFRVNCAPCHRTAVRGGALAFVGVNAPALTNKSAALIAGAIRWGPGAMPRFPPSMLNDQQVDSIVEYIRQAAQHPASPGGSPMNWYGPVAEGFAAWVLLLVMLGFTFWIEKGGKG
jgi:ubiquinol-cytochrome c reductase cytochrome c subunit